MSVNTVPAIEHELSRGLSGAEAKRRLEQFGANELTGGDERSLWAIGFNVLREPMFLLLVAGGVIYLAIGDVREALILLASVLVVIVITIYQQRKTERTLEALRDIASPRALVVRDGRQQRIAGRDVVPGDVVMLSEGDRIPADGVMLKCADFSTDESLLTGESLPVAKCTPVKTVTRMETPAGDDTPFVYSGTLVVKGHGVARVLATGGDTQLGRIGLALHGLRTENTPLQRQTAQLVRVFASIGLGLCIFAVILYGALRGDWWAGLLAGITLAMAILPEEFPVVLTVFLALGAWRISQQRVLTRRMPAIETLGSATVLCVDKTGTLTESRMTLAAVVTHQQCHETADGALAASTGRTVHAAALACEIVPSDPMERAILRYAAEADRTIEDVRTHWHLVREYDFTSGLPAVTHCWQSPDGNLVVASKGAPEAISRLCNADPALHAWILEHTGALAARGQRVLGVAEANFDGPTLPADPTGFDFSFLGLIALADPVRADVHDAIRECQHAGIRIIMITGDYPGTAETIARQIGLHSPGGVLTGTDLTSLRDEELRRRVQYVSIFGRVVPEQKLALVNALKANGEIVAMTGDGVNDAPALKAAHIGIAMGNRGTDVAREAASLVLLDDRFASIVETIRLGRRIFDNIRHAMAYLVAVHVPIAGMSLVPLIAGWPLALTPVHIVFFEFVSDPACSIAFEAEPAHRGVMQRSPRNPREPLLTARLLLLALLQGLTLLAVTVWLYWFALTHDYGEERARALAFAAIVLGNISLILINRSQTLSLIMTLSLPNRAQWLVVGATFAGLLLVLYVPVLRDVFHFVEISGTDWLLALVAPSAAIAWTEGLKWMIRRRSNTLPDKGAGAAEL